jgi:hypothetical protein
MYIRASGRTSRQQQEKLRGFSPQANYTDEPPPLVGEVSANFSGQSVSRGQRNGSPSPLIYVF